MSMPEGFRLLLPDEMIYFEYGDSVRVLEVATGEVTRVPVVEITKPALAVRLRGGARVSLPDSEDFVAITNRMDPIAQTFMVSAQVAELSRKVDALMAENEQMREQMRALSLQKVA